MKRVPVLNVNGYLPSSEVMADRRKVTICPEEADKNHNEKKTHRFKQLFKGKNKYMSAFNGFS